MMDQKRILSEFRNLIGSPDVRTVSADDLRRRYHSQLEWLAGELRYAVRVDERSLGLVASEQDLPLPRDAGQLLWVEYNGTALTPATVAEWVRDGTDWRGATAGTPREYAVQARTLILYPKPSSAAVTTDSLLSFAYIQAAPELQASGTPLLSDQDVWLAIYAAAGEWLGLHPSQENLIRRQVCETELQKRLPQARMRHQQPVRNHNPRQKFATRRTGTAR